jgi:hypothetical protein
MARAELCVLCIHQKPNMPLEFTRVSKEQPCPVCLRTDFCEIGSRAVLCQRVASPHPNKNPAGGWFHHFGDKNAYRPPSNALPRRSKPVLKEASALLDSLRYLTSEKQYREIGCELNVSVESLKLTGAVWYANYNAWAWPMYDENLEVIGIRLRNSDGFKWAVSGSRNGVFLPSNVPENEPYVFVPEGPSDVCALTDLGFFPIGRPTCGTGFEIIKSLLERWNIYKVVIVADNDELKFAGDRKFRPGIDSAQKLKKFLRIKSCIWIPPSPLKDVRDFVREGGTRQMIEQSIKGKVWTKE